MKKIMVLITVCMFSLIALAQDQGDKKMQDQTAVKYCAKMKGGQIIVTQNKNDLVIDVTLANGTTVKTDGTIIKADGTRINLKKGECIDNTGNKTD